MGKNSERKLPEKTEPYTQMVDEERKSKGTKTQLTTSPTFSSGGELWMQWLFQRADPKRRSRDPQCTIGPIALPQ